MPTAMAMALVGTGCSDDGEEVERRGAIAVASNQDGDGGDEAGAEVGGVIALQDGCALLERDGARFFVVWPPDTAWSETSMSVRLDDGLELVEGDLVSGGGIYLDPNEDATNDLLSAVQDVAGECVDLAEEVAVFNSTGQIYKL